MLILGQPPSRHPLLYRALGVRRDQESYSRRTMRDPTSPQFSKSLLDYGKVPG